jgi:ATP-binding cassette subfamily B protein RaxB
VADDFGWEPIAGVESTSGFCHPTQLPTPLRQRTPPGRANLTVPLRLPCILHWDHNHFVVLTRVGRHRMVTHDPAVGYRYVPMREVDKRFTGIALEAWLTEGFERKIESARVQIWDLLRRTDGFAAVTTQVLTMSLVLEAIGIAIPIGFQLVLDDVIVSETATCLP